MDNKANWHKIKATVSVQHHNFLVAEVERLRAENEHLRATIQPVIEQAELDESIGRRFPQFDIYEISLTGKQVEALRRAVGEG